MLRASGNLGAGGSPRTGRNVRQTGRLLRCSRARVFVIDGDTGTGSSPVAGRNLGGYWRFGAVRILVASRRPGAKGDSPRQPACTALYRRLST